MFLGRSAVWIISFWCGSSQLLPSRETHNLELISSLLIRVTAMDSLIYTPTVMGGLPSSVVVKTVIVSLLINLIVRKGLTDV